MAFYACGAAEFLDESWKRPKRHNRRIERAALWHTVALDEDCGKALDLRRSVLLLPGATDTRTRYELQAGIRTVTAIVPFTITERIALRGEELATGNTLFHDESAVQDATLFERWHEWLWMDGHGVPQTSTEALGASAVLGEACGRLTNALFDLLGLSGTG
ncbi:MAG TPA: hypothetical protein VK790_01255 [Solirubrobacteraceae bacterium]|nr:hypothetical protein [Solirubrobacteraceae bacterium]